MRNWVWGYLIKTCLVNTGSFSVNYTKSFATTHIIPNHTGGKHRITWIKNFWVLTPPKMISAKCKIAYGARRITSVRDIDISDPIKTVWESQNNVFNKSYEALLHGSFEYIPCFQNAKIFKPTGSGSVKVSKLYGKKVIKDQVCFYIC